MKFIPKPKSTNLSTKFIQVGEEIAGNGKTSLHIAKEFRRAIRLADSFLVQHRGVIFSISVALLIQVLLQH
ncbi:hypothetical protein M758_6G210400 [Ceratodon purpureus]|nr:hypothetical protein M758_6G210400 [Ceratodon purpureus]